MEGQGYAKMSSLMEKADPNIQLTDFPLTDMRFGLH